MSRIRLAWTVTSVRRAHVVAYLSVTALVLSAAAGPVAACPFCSAIALTFGEEINGADVAVVARLVELPPEPKNGSALSGSDAKAKFEILDILKGEKALGKARKFSTLYFGKEPVGTMFLVMGVEPPEINWSTPIPVTQRGREYLAKSLRLPKEGPERLAFFQDFLEDDDPMLGRDAYDEFAKTPYAGLQEIKDIMHHDKIVAWAQDPKIPQSRKNLYWMMLGICGKPADLELFERQIRADDMQIKSNALFASYLTLKGADGIKLLEDLFLKNPDANYIDTYATVIAIRFHGQEEQVIPRARLLESLRYMLDRPQLADLVIPDLGRWQDWSVMDRLVELFKDADEKSIWVRVPVISYLRACPLPKAKQYIDELTKIDPDAVKRANSLFPLSSGTAADKSAAPAADTPAKDAPAGGDKKPAATGAGTAPGGKKVSGQPGSVPPGGKKTSQANKPVVDSAAEVVTDTRVTEADQARLGPESAAQSAAAKSPTSQAAARVSPRLSRSGAPGAKIPQVALWQVLGSMALSAGVLSIFLVAILRGGQEAAS